jgi:hypothetical protein
MRLKVQVIIESESGEAEMVQEIAKLERQSLRPETLGLTLSEVCSLEEGDRFGQHFIHDRLRHAF